jgi:hypothetical protein
MNSLPLTRIGDLDISRIVCGTNPFFGFSHFTRARDMWQKAYFTDARIKKIMSRACQLGINAVVSGPQERLDKVLRELGRKGHEMHWICTPGGSTVEEVEGGITWCKDHNVKICMPHQNYTDNNLVPAREELVGYGRIRKAIRSGGMIPGLSTHRPETVVTMDRSGEDVETYVLPFNAQGFLSNVEVEWVSRVISNSHKPIIVIKPLAAGRITPEVGLPFVLRAIKESDAVAIGFSSIFELEEDLQIVGSTLSSRPEELPLSTSRSKAIFD